jgi:hypothetical protein
MAFLMPDLQARAGLIYIAWRRARLTLAIEAPFVDSRRLSCPPGESWTFDCCGNLLLFPITVATPGVHPANEKPTALD